MVSIYGMKQYAEYDAISNEIGIILNKWDDGMYGRIGDEALILNRIHDENDRSKYTNSKLFFEKFIITIMYEYSFCFIHDGNDVYNACIHLKTQ